jgi:hypothetical protein
VFRLASIIAALILAACAGPLRPVGPQGLPVTLGQLQPHAASVERRDTNAHGASIAQYQVRTLPPYAGALVVFDGTAEADNAMVSTSRLTQDQAEIMFARQCPAMRVVEMDTDGDSTWRSFLDYAVGAGCSRYCFAYQAQIDGADRKRALSIGGLHCNGQTSLPAFREQMLGAVRSIAPR